jgi:hypothetical protein
MTAYLCCCAPLVGGTKRGELRVALNIKPDGFCCIQNDCLVHCCCPCCALQQEKALLDENKCTIDEPATMKMARGAKQGQSVELSNELNNSNV